MDLYRHMIVEDSNTSISLPPAPIQETPTVIVEGIVLGNGTYYDIDLPEITVDVIKVEDGLVHYTWFCDGLRVLPTHQFLNRYANREQTRISSL